MFVYSKDQKRFVNSDNISAFRVQEIVTDIETVSPTYFITADNTMLCEYATLEDAKKELKAIMDSLISGATSYQIE